MGHQTEVTIRWGDTDAAGLIYYPQFFHYTVVALNDYFSPAVETGHLMEQFRREDRFLPSVDASASFSSPLRAGDDVTVVTEVTDLGESSLTMAFTFETDDETDGESEPAATVEVTFVLVDNAFEACSLPAAVRACVERRGDAPTT